MFDSEFCLSRLDSPNRSPKLFRPVDVEVRVEASIFVGSASSLGTFRRELSVDARSRKPIRLDGDDLFEFVDPFLLRGEPGAAAKPKDDLARAVCEGDDKAVDVISWLGGKRTAPIVEESLSGDGVLALNAPCCVGTASGEPCSGGMTLGGSGNRGALGFLLGSRKKVVVVCTVVCVVVVAAYTLVSAEWSDREDSEKRFAGRANAVPLTSP